MISIMSPDEAQAVLEQIKLIVPPKETIDAWTGEPIESDDFETMPCECFKCYREFQRTYLKIRDILYAEQ